MILPFLKIVNYIARHIFLIRINEHNHSSQN